MNILFISHLSGAKADGLNWAIPSTVENLAKVNSCLWINLTLDEMSHWKEITAFHKLMEFDLKTCFNTFHPLFKKPDIVVFYGIYFYQYINLFNNLKRHCIPFIIQPASSLTYQAQHNHAFLKKRIANFFIFNRFIKEASAIHYLTEDESRDSGTKWNKHSFVLPNGINIPASRKTEFSTTEIKACFIGRIDIYQKGLDLLLEAIKKIQEQLREASFSLKIFGPIDHDAKKIASLIKKYSISDIVSLEGEVSGQKKEAAFLNSDLFVLTSRFEGHSIALLEALSYGLPVAITPGTNMKQKVQQYDAGWCSEDTTVDGICEMLFVVIRERESFASKGQHSVELAKTYDYSEIANKLHNELKKTINNDGESSDI